MVVETDDQISNSSGLARFGGKAPRTDQPVLVHYERL